MKKKLILLATALALFTAVKTYVCRPTADLVAEWFRNPYEGMFTGEARLTIAGRGYGVYTGGFKGLALYGSLLQCAVLALSNEGRPLQQADFYDLTPFSKLAREPVFKKVLARDYGTFLTQDNNFNRWNPEFIKWGIANCIPSPDLKIGGVTCKEIYDKVFFRFFRLLAETHRYLDRENRFAKEAAVYQDAMRVKKFEALAWLEARYGSLFPQYTVEGAYSPFTPGMAVGFWLRRELDGTRDLFRSGLDLFMYYYDREWHIKLKTEKQ